MKGPQYFPTDWDDDWDGIDDDHGGDCDCDDCRLEEAMDECGLLPDDLGGGCTMAGTEFCDFDCPMRDMPEIDGED